MLGGELRDPELAHATNCSAWMGANEYIREIVPVHTGSHIVPNREYAYRRRL